MKIYTRTGDKGTTGLYGGERVLKSTRRVGAYGTVDEANSALGLARSFIGDSELDALLSDLQNALFDVGADLATPFGTRQRDRIVPIDEEDVARLEALIDRYDAELEPLSNFILPGGDTASAGLQLARSVVRRAEREVVALAQEEEVNPQVTVYLNRLSDLLFTLARLANVRAGVSEVRWHVKQRSRP